MANELFETGGVGETKLHVAMFVHRFPLVSETFVINQVVGLMRLGYEVDIYSFGAQPPSAALTQPDVAQYRLLEHTKYPAVSPRDGLKFLRCGVRQAATLLRSQPKVLARSLDLSSHRREALLLRLLSMVWLLRDRKTYDVVHCQFGTVGRMVLPLLECGLLNGALVVAFRGSDISQFLKQRGERIYDGLLRRGDYFFTNCRYFQCRLMALGCDPQRLEALYSGIDFNKFRFSRRQRRSDRPEQLSRGETGLAEFHCMLVRTDLFAKLGRLDEAFLNTKEHVDFSMAARQSGERIFFEPASVVTYIFDKPLAFSDYPYFMLRWSDEWEVSTLTRMREKWRLDDDGYFANRISHRGWRRNLAIWRPVANMLSFGWKNRLLSRTLFAFDRFMLNRFISERYRRRYGESTILEPAVRLSKAQQTET